MTPSLRSPTLGHIVGLTSLYALLVTTFLLCLHGCGNNTDLPAGTSEKVTKPKVTPSQFIQVPPAAMDRVKVEPVSTHPIGHTIEAPGEVVMDPKRVSKITARIPGQVEHIYVQLGDRVVPGQPLIALESLQLDELVQEYLVSKSQATVATDNYTRSQRLHEEKIISERRLIEDRGHYLEATARHQHVREKLEGMGLTAAELRQLEHGSHQEGHRYLLRAPLRGRVVNQNVVLGQGVEPGNDLAEVVDTSVVWVFANLSIEDARRFKEGDTASILPKGGEPVTAPLTYMAPVAEEKTRTVTVRFEVANPTGALKPHEFVEARLSVEGAPALAVPRAAVSIVDNVQGVFLKRSSGFTFTPIQTGREDGGWVEILGGVVDGDQIVTAGTFDLKNEWLKGHIASGEGS